MARRVPETLQVYRHDTRYTLPPDSIVPYAEGKLLVDEGAATFCRHNKGIRLKGPRGRALALLADAMIAALPTQTAPSAASDDAALQVPGDVRL